VCVDCFSEQTMGQRFFDRAEAFSRRRLGPKIHWIEVSWRKWGINKTWKMVSTRDGGGRFWDFSSHMVDQLLVLLHPARVTRVHCTLSCIYPDLPHTDTHALLTLTFSTPLVATVHTSSASFYDKPRWLICGDVATYVKHGVDPQEAAMVAGNIEACPADSQGELLSEGGKTGVETVKGEWLKFYENVASAVKGGEVAVKPESVVRMLRVLEAALESAEKGVGITTDI